MSRVQISPGPLSKIDDKHECVCRKRSSNNEQKGFDSKQEFESLKKHLESSLPYLPKHHMEELRKLVLHQFKKRFKRGRMPKYGSLNKGFTEPELQRFFRAIDSDKFRLLFSYQSQLGLRIGEVVCINIKDIKLETRELFLKTEKSRTMDSLLIPTPLFKATSDFIQANSAEIEKSHGFVFFKEGASSRKELSLGVNYARNRFRYYITRAGLTETYDQSDESLESRTPRNLHRLTTHSLRHYAITSFSKQTNGNVVLTSRYARHVNPNTTMTYISTRKEELYKEIDNTFSIEHIKQLKARIK